MNAAAPHPVHLKRALGLPAVLLFGLAYMAPLIVYGTYGVLAQASHDTAALAYVIALGAILFTAISYGHLARRHPVAGSAYTYTREAFHPNLGFLVGWATLLDYFFIPMVIWLVGASYLGAAFPQVPTWAWILAFIAVSTALNVVGIEVAAGLTVLLMVVQLAICALFIYLCWRHAAAGAGTAGVDVAAPFRHPQVPLSATMAGAAIGVYSFLGFDAVSTMTEETHEPERNIPRAILWIALLGGVIFIAAAYTLQLAHPGSDFRNADEAAFEVAGEVGGAGFVTLFTLGLALSQFAAGISAQASVGRLLYAMGRDHVLPARVFARLHPRFRTPVTNILLSGLAGLVALGMDVATSTSFINFGAFLAFTAVNLCVVRLQWTGQLRLGRVVGIALPAVGAVADLWLLSSLEPTAIVLGLVWFAGGLCYLLWRTQGLRRAIPVPAESGTGS